MLFKKKKKTNNFIKDDELSNDSLETKQSFLSEFFHKYDENNNTNEDTNTDSVESNDNSMLDNGSSSNDNNSMLDNNSSSVDNNMGNVEIGNGMDTLSDMYGNSGSMLDSNTNSSNSMVDINTNPTTNNNEEMDMINTPVEDKKDNNIPTTKVKSPKFKRKRGSEVSGIFDKLFDLIFVALLVFLFLRYSPKIVTFYGNGKVKYAKMATEMATEIKDYYEQEGQKCSTNTPRKYYFNLYDSTERFGKKYKSPYLKRAIEGYVEIQDDGRTVEYYVYFSDGLFGVHGVKLEDIDKGDIELFTFLTLDHPEAMECKIKFENKM